MGGDNIGSSLVRLSTGYDYVNAVIDVCLGIRPVYDMPGGSYAGIRFIFGLEDLEALDTIKRECPEMIVEEDVRRIDGNAVTDSSTRFGFFTMASSRIGDILRFMPDDK